ncbi:MAG: tetratricopeptide repeat protein [Chloroflexi bacterium]|nr:MAG: tetratricopeptide repeat protein [Chloroflexota bacterium]
MDAKTLYQQGVTAIRDQQDPQRGRDLLIQSLRQDPRNDMAWLWLTRTVQDRSKQLEYVDRALTINPSNDAALKLKARLQAALQPPAIQPLATLPLATQPPPAPVAASENTALVVSAAAVPALYKTVDVPATLEEKARIAQLMERADIYATAGEIESAIGQWVDVLTIRVDHEAALRHAAGHLWRLNYQDDARELVQRALDAGTTVPTIYLTAIDMAERLGDVDHAEELRAHVISMPQADDPLLVAIADDYIRRFRNDEALAFLRRALEARPHSQALLIKTGDLLKEMDRNQEAMTYYDRAVRTGARTAKGREADKKLLNFVPVLTDRERGSVGLALREAAGITLLFLMMGWQDAGLDLLDLGVLRWFGVVLAMIGGYLVITATSSPQQKPVASWLGGQVPPDQPDPNKPLATPGRALAEPTHLPLISEDVRYVLGTVGALLLVIAFVLVFHHSLGLITENPPPYMPWSNDS